MAEIRSQLLLRNYQQGDDVAAAAIFDRYAARLEALTRARMARACQGRFDPEDVVQSAFRSFFINARHDVYTLSTAGDLWRLLAAITLNKLHRQIERQTAQKRDARRETATETELGITAEPTAADVAAVVEEFHLALKCLSTVEQRALALELEGQSLVDISLTLGKSERAARRYLAEARQTIERRLLHAQVARPPIEDSPDAPLRYADYLLERMIGAGGMGKVYRATEIASARVVALKSLLKSQLADARAVKRFVQESQILTRLEHPHIVRTHGLGRYPGGGYFIVMDLIDGVDLESERKRRGFSSVEITSIAEQVAGALAYAHRNCIVHCDVKPANILLQPNGHAVVTDFGFAHLTAPTQGKQAIGGTPGYIAPEVRRGAEPTPAADIYAIGTLLRVLTTGSTAGELVADADEGSRALMIVWQRCQEPKPAKRYATASELIADLIRIPSNRPKA